MNLKRCHDCAFTTGTEASRHQHTRDLAELCVMGATEFSCHVRPGPCAGWLGQFMTNAASGVYENEFKTRLARVLADVAADRIQQAADGIDVSDEQFHQAVLTAIRQEFTDADQVPALVKVHA